MDREERRRRVIALLEAGRRVMDICRELGRSREWLAKWRRRAAQGGEGLRDRSRAPMRRVRALPARVTRAVIAARERLERRGRGRRFAGVGAGAVAWELELACVRPLPSRRTIERILARHGKTARRRQAGATLPAARTPRQARRAREIRAGHHPIQLQKRGGPVAAGRRGYWGWSTATGTAGVNSPSTQTPSRARS